MKVRELLNLQCSFFNNTFSRPVGVVTVRSLFDTSLQREKLTTYPWTAPDITKALPKTSGALDTFLVKHVQKNGKDALYNSLKEYQVALTPSGLFEERRRYEYLTQANPLVIIDIDNVEVSKEYIDGFKRYPWVVGAGESVSRKGVWILVYIENPSLIKEHFHALRTKIFTQADDLKDITRLRYVSYGYAWCRKDTIELKPYTDTVALPGEDIYETKKLEPTTKYDTAEEIEHILATVGSIEESGGFHPWTIRVGARCNRKGITCGYAIKELWKRIQSLPVIRNTARYTVERFTHDISSVYTLYKHEHHITTKVRITRGKIGRFGPDIFKRSPGVLRDLIALVEQDEEKEVVYFTSLILLGVLFPNKYFRYFNNNYHPNLYGYIIGEAASFKGKAKILRQAMKPYQRRIDEEFKFRSDQRDADVAYNKGLAKTQEERRVIEKIPDLNLFFDGNTSSAAMLKAMQDSPVLVMFETEGDTVAKTWKTDWGNYSDVLRKTFEHESLYSLKRQGSDENLQRIRIENPKLSLLVSSTENQMRKILNSDETENGLISRFLFYIVQNDKTWYDGFNNNYDQDIERILSERLTPDHWYTSCFSANVQYIFSKEAHAYHQEYFNHVNDNWPDDLFNIISVVRRSATSCARIAMTLEELYALDRQAVRTGLTVRQYTVSGQTMLLAIDIMKILLQHLFVAWQVTYKTEDFKDTNIQDGEIRKRVTDALTEDPTKGYKRVAEELGITREKARYHIKIIREQAEVEVKNRVSSESPRILYDDKTPTNQGVRGVKENGTPPRVTPPVGDIFD